VTATWQIIEGDCRQTLATLPAGSVQTCVTSPPYFGLRSYGDDPAEIGKEPTPDEFVAALVGVFREVRRVLRDDGTVWLNLGDSYAGSWGAQSRGGPPSESSTLRGNGHVGGGPKAKSISAVQIAAHPKGQTHTGSIPKGADYKAKDLLMVPALVALALRSDGWYLRDEIVWHKPAPMPTSAIDRTCRAHEVIYLLSKGPRYFYDQKAIAEPATSNHDSGNGYARPEQLARGGRGQAGPWKREDNPTRIKRSVWEVDEDEFEQFLRWKAEHEPVKPSVWKVGTANFSAAHFATFPPKLIEPCILAGCPERACGECGAPWERIVAREVVPGARDAGRVVAQESKGALTAHSGHRGSVVTETVGFAPSCGHDAPHVPGVVLDPFAGAGTTGLVALRHGRSFIGCELSSDYVRLARDRIIADSPLLNTHAERAATAKIAHT
jgi:DNA modification methylase